MARVSVAAQSVGSDLKLEDATFTAFVAADDAVVTGASSDTILVFKNGGTSGSQTATVISVSDEFGRSGDLAVAVGQDDISFAGKFIPNHWFQAGTVTINIDVTTEDVFSVAAINFDYRT